MCNGWSWVVLIGGILQVCSHKLKDDEIEHEKVDEWN